MAAGAEEIGAYHNPKPAAKPGAEKGRSISTV
jgi:hypothetical protein